MTIKLVYSDSCAWLSNLVDFLKINKIELETFDEMHPKEKKKAIVFKVSCGARLNPFVAVYDDKGELIKGFYSEVGECTLNNIKQYIEEWQLTQ